MKRVYTPEEVEELAEAIRSNSPCGICKYADADKDEVFYRICSPCLGHEYRHPNFELCEK